RRRPAARRAGVTARRGGNHACRLWRYAGGALLCRPQRDAFGPVARRNVCSCSAADRGAAARPPGPRPGDRARTWRQALVGSQSARRVRPVHGLQPMAGAPVARGRREPSHLVSLYRRRRDGSARAYAPHLPGALACEQLGWGETLPADSLWEGVMYRKLAAEFLGTATLVLIGCGAAVLGGAHVGQLGIALAFGLAIVA